MTTIGAYVARSRDSYIHIARIVKSDGLVIALCGNTLIRPHTGRLTGPPCVACQDISGAPLKRSEA